MNAISHKNYLSRSCSKLLYPELGHYVLVVLAQHFLFVRTPHTVHDPAIGDGFLSTQGLRFFSLNKRIYYLGFFGKHVRKVFQVGLSCREFDHSITVIVGELLLLFLYDL